MELYAWAHRTGSTISAKNCRQNNNAITVTINVMDTAIIQTGPRVSSYSYKPQILSVLTNLNCRVFLLDSTLQGRGAKLSLHSRVQQQNGFLNNVRPTSPTPAPQNIVQDPICRPENPELLNVSSVENKRGPERGPESGP